MWSILTDPLPDVISVNGVSFGVHTDFRVWLRVGQALSDAGTEIEPTAANALIKTLVDLVVPTDEKPNGFIPGADFIEAVSTFYAGPKREEKDPEEPEAPEANQPKAVRTFDFLYDSGYIYQSFASFYHIRLAAERMHWWEFLTLFDGLMFSDENSFNFVLGVRQKKIGDVPRSQRGAYTRMKKAFALPKSETQTAAENAVYEKLEALWNENSEPKED